MWFHSCYVCKNKRANNVDRIPTMAGDLVYRYCDKCWHEKLSNEKNSREESTRRYEEYVKERKIQHQYEVLEEKIRRAELERKAKELGIDFDGQV